jgi:hypothetical protein
MKKKTRSSCWLVLALLAGILSGCQPESSPSTTTQIADFIPPTQNPAILDIQTEEINPLPTRQTNCDNQLLFLDDLTIPDGTEVSPGDEVVKRWLIRNEGSCNWNRSYSLQLISGLSLSAGKEKALYPARQSSEAVIEIRFTAPSNPGNYNSWWQAYDPDGNRFGDPIFMEISVVDE